MLRISMHCIHRVSGQVVIWSFLLGIKKVKFQVYGAKYPAEQQVVIIWENIRISKNASVETYKYK